MGADAGKPKANTAAAARDRTCARIVAIPNTMQPPRNRAPDADHKQRAELFRAQIPLSENKPDEALALYRKFAKDHPDSKYMDRVRSFIDKLEAGGSPR